MKRLLIAVLACVLIVGLVQAQGTSTRNFEVKESGLRTIGGTVISAKAYANSQVDTTQAQSAYYWAAGYVSVRAMDSVDVSVGYMPSYDGVTFGALVAIGSVTLKANPPASGSGNVGAVALPAACLALPAFRLTFTFAGSDNGVTSATYYAKLLLKR